MFFARPTGLLASCAALLLSCGCTSSSVVVPDKAIAGASAEPTGVETIVQLTVKNTNPGAGADAGGFYLNSEADYRDPRSLNIIVSPAAAAEFAAAGVTDHRAAFLGRDILVNGIVRRVRIDHVDERGRPTGGHYFQTQLAVSSARQITWAESGKTPDRRPVIDSARAKPLDYLENDPTNPIRALYVYELQKRIDTLFGRELFAAYYGSGINVPPGRRIRFMVTVLSDGRIAADIEEIKSQLKREPELAAVVLRVLMKITADPRPFPAAMIESGHNMIRYEAAFGVE